MQSDPIFTNTTGRMLSGFLKGAANSYVINGNGAFSLLKKDMKILVPQELVVEITVPY